MQVVFWLHFLTSLCFNGYYFFPPPRIAKITPNTISGDTSIIVPSPKFTTNGCPNTIFLTYKHAANTVGVLTKMRLYRCSTGLVSPLSLFPYAPVTMGGRIVFADLHSHNGPLFFCVGGLSPNRIEFRVNDIVGGVKSSSSEYLVL